MTLDEVIVALRTNDQSKCYREMLLAVAEELSRVKRGWYDGHAISVGNPVWHDVVEAKRRRVREEMDQIAMRHREYSYHSSYQSYYNPATSPIYTQCSTSPATPSSDSESGTQTAEAPTPPT